MNNQKKMILIEKIREIIKKHGDFTESDIERDYVPSISVAENTVHLIEEFNFRKCTVRVYDEGGSASLQEYETNYLKLPLVTLKYILELAQKWAQLKK